VIRYTEYGIPHIVAGNYPDLGFGTGWAQAADQVCTLADGFVTVRGERSRYLGADAATDFSLSSAADNLSSDLYFRGVRQSRTVERLLAEPAPLGPSKDVEDLMRGFAAGYDAWLAQNRINDPACRGAAWVRPITTTDVAARLYAISVLGGQGGSVDEITGAQPPTGAAKGTGATLDAQALQGGTRPVRGLRHGVERRRLQWRHHGERAGPAAGQPALPLARRAPLLAGAADHPGLAERRRSRAAGLAGRLHRLQLPCGVEPHRRDRGSVRPHPADALVDGRPERMTRRTVTVAVETAPP